MSISYPFSLSVNETSRHINIIIKSEVDFQWFHYRMVLN